MSLIINHKEILDNFPKAIIFDTDNTLYPYAKPHNEAMAAVLEKSYKLFGVPPERFQKVFSEARKHVKQRLGNTASSHSRLLYFQTTIELLGLRTQLLATLDLEQTYWRTFLTHCELFPGVVEFIQDVRNKGVHTAVITDLTSQIQFRKIIYFGLDKYFDYVVTSEESGADKPDHAPYKLALNKLGFEPEQIWMIGDHPINDIKGARTFRMGVLQKRHQDVDVSKVQGKYADIVFDNYRELRKLIHTHLSGKM